MTKRQQIEQVHEKFINEQNDQAVQQIDDFNNMHDFWEEYRLFIDQTYLQYSIRYKYFTDHVIIFNRIKHK